MKKMIYFAAFAIMMAMGNMNAFANRNGGKHNEYDNDKGRMEMHFDGHRLDMHGHKMLSHERRMIEERRRMEEHRRMEEARRREEMHRREAHRHHMAHSHEVHAVSGNVVAGVAVGAAVAALVSALIK